MTSVFWNTYRNLLVFRLLPLPMARALTAGLVFLGMLTRRYRFVGPRILQLSLSAGCDHDCTFCITRNWPPAGTPPSTDQATAGHRPPLSFEQIKVILKRQLEEGTLHYNLVSDGEPLLYPKIRELIEFLTSESRGRASIQIITNGTSLNRLGVDFILKHHLKLWISLHAGDFTTWKTIHRPKPAVSNGEKAFYDLKDLLKVLSPKLGRNLTLHTVLCNQNWDRLTELAEYFRHVDAKKVHFGRMIHFEELQLSVDQEKAVLSKLQALAQAWSRQGVEHNIAEYESVAFKKPTPPSTVPSPTGATPLPPAATYSSEFYRTHDCYLGWLMAFVEPSGALQTCGAGYTLAHLSNPESEKGLPTRMDSFLRQSSRISKASPGHVAGEALSGCRCQDCPHVQMNRKAHAWVSKFRLPMLLLPMFLVVGSALTSFSGCATFSAPKPPVQRDLEALLANARRPVKLSTFAQFFKRTQELQALPEEQRTKLMDQMEDLLADSASDDERYQGYFHSTIVHLAHDSLKPLFGEKPEGLTQLTWQRTGSHLKPAVLASLPLTASGKGKSEDTGFGFFEHKLPEVQIPLQGRPGTVLLDHEIHWNVVGINHQARLTVTLAEPHELAPPAPAPDYPALWKDGTLTGLVVTGATMSLATAESVMDEYLEYFREEGFSFDRDSAGDEILTEIEDLPAYLEEKISSGEVDYLVKEAHSDGDDQNFLKMDQSARLMHGTRPGPKKEQILLIYPRADRESDPRPEPRLVSNFKFGDWVRARPDPLIYLNTSCWSYSKAVNELEAARTPKLVEIPSLTSIWTFSNEQESAMRILIENFRAGKTYAEIRAAMKKNHLNRSEKSNILLFPDDPRYERYIRQVLRTPLEIRQR